MTARKSSVCLLQRLSIFIVTSVLQSVLLNMLCQRHYISASETVFIFIERMFIMNDVYYYLLENKTCNLFITNTSS